MKRIISVVGLVILLAAAAATVWLVAGFGAEPVSDPSMYPSFVNPDAILVSPLFKSDVSDLEHGVNAKGERRGLIAFQIIGVGEDPDGGGSCLPNLIIRFVSTSSINLDEVSIGSGASVSSQLVE